MRNTKGYNDNYRRKNAGTKQSMRTSKKIHRKKGTGMMLRFFTGVFAVLLIIGCSCGFGSFFSSAHGNSEEEPVEYKYYKSVEIREGDSLWSIAKEYMGSEYESVYEYMDELADINHIEAYEMDELREGDYLTIAYYDSDYRE